MNNLHIFCHTCTKKTKYYLESHKIFIPNSNEIIEDIKKTNQLIELRFKVMLYNGEKCKVYLLKYRDKIPANLTQITNSNINVFTALPQFIAKVRKS